MGFLIAAIIITAILLLRLSVRIRTDGGLTLIAGVGFIKIKLLPQREKKLKLRDYRIDRFRKRLRSEELADEKKRLKKQKKQAKKAEKAKEIESDRSDEPEAEEKTDLCELISKLTRVAKVFIVRFGKHLRIGLRKIKLSVATGDAAQTAILYGAIIGAVQNLYALLVSSGTLKTAKNSELTVEPDFLSEKPSVEIDLTFSFRLWQLFDIAIRSLIAYIKD